MSEIETVAYPQEVVAFAIDSEEAKANLLLAAEALGSLNRIDPTERIALSKMLWKMANDLIPLTQQDLDNLHNWQ